MTILTIRKRTAEAVAIRFTGDNTREIVAWISDLGGEAYEGEAGRLYVVTDRGDVVAEPGDYVIQGVAGEFYPCTEEAFAAGWEVIQ